MRALTLTQPWAGLVASGIKLVENRPRKMIKVEDFGRQFAIHASREVDGPTFDRIAEIAPELGISVRMGWSDAKWNRLGQITSAVIAVAKIDGITFNGRRIEHWGGRTSDLDEAQRRWFFGPIGYVLRDVIPLAIAVPCRGWQGFWTLDNMVERAVTEQLA